MKTLISSLATVLLATTLACSADEQVGMPCKDASECYPDVSDKSTLLGSVQCLTKFAGGYCTHTCTSDSDCCAKPGECRAGFKQVCAPFENQPMMYCFLSCDAPDISASPNDGTTEPNAYCQKFAGEVFTCRSTGGGTANRKFCG